MKHKILVATEGLTERVVGKKLFEKEILDATVSYELMKGRRQGQTAVLNELLRREGRGGLLTTWQNLFLMFDQENLRTPQDTAKIIIDHFQNYGQRNDEALWKHFTLQPYAPYDNIFVHRSEQFRMVLHIADSAGPGGSKDFDGYILQLLQSAVGEQIAQRLVSRDLARKLLHKAEYELPALMSENGYPINHAKSWLYAYITAFQYNQSHVWFAAEVVDVAPTDALQTTFASLIAAWNFLKEAIQ